MKQYFWSIATCCVVAALTSTAHAQWGGPTKVVVVPAELKKLPATTTLVGTVEPVTRSMVGAEIGGLVKDMPVRQGDFLKAGELICKLNDDNLRFELAQADARLAALEADVRRWSFEMERIQALYGDQDAAAKEVYETRASEEGAAAKVAEQKEAIDRLKSDLAKTEIRAPISGTIVKRVTEVGQWLIAGGQVVEMVELAKVLVTVDTPESAMAHVHRGAPASVRIDALGHRFEGTVKHVILQTDPIARTFPVQVEVANPGYVAAFESRDEESALSAALEADVPPIMVGGMFARVTLITGPSADVPAVPKDAIVNRHGTEYVAVVMPGREPDSLMGMPMPVTTGVDIGDWIAITSNNIQPGMQVVTRGNEGISYPQPVIILDGPVADGTETVTSEPGPSQGRPSHPGRPQGHPQSHGGS